MAGVYVQADQGEKADVFSTALFAMGYEKAKQWLQKNQLVEVMLISLEGAVFKTEGFEGKLNA
jgi:thiamine biosynthesis lipoprotein ApbE